MNDIQKVIKKLDLVQNIGGDGMMKVSGYPINFAIPEDEFARFLISEIRNLYLCVKTASELNDLKPEEIKIISGDIKTYIEYFEGACSAYLQESKCKTLLEN